MISALWRRLDLPGHDACRVRELAQGFELDGAAVFRAERGGIARLVYHVTCDRGWQTTHGRVQGWVAGETIDLTIERVDGIWRLDGALADGLEDCCDLDLGFTPATNLTQVRRLALAVGASAEVPVAWLDVDTWSLQRLPQRYERRSPHTYAYESPTFEYSGLLEVSRDGFVTRYPDLWELESVDER